MPVGINFTQPYVLVILPVLLYLTFRTWNKGALLFGARFKTALTLRVIIISALVLALAGLEFVYSLDKQGVIFVADVSVSTQKVITEGEEWIKQAIKDKKPEDQFSVIAFGREAMVDQPLTSEGEFYQIESVPAPHATDISSGLRLAGALLPLKSQKRVVLISDGKQNLGNAVETAHILKNQGVRVDVVPLEVIHGKEVLISRIETPEFSRKGERVELKVVVESSIATNASLRLFADNHMVLEQKVSLNVGENIFSLGVKEDNPGFHIYRGVIEPDVDTNIANNEAAAFTRVQGNPVILVVEGKAGEGAQVKKALESTGFAVKLITGQEVPRSLTGFKQYASVVLVNVKASTLGNKVMEIMRTAVRDLGLGLVMVGGEDSFGLGGYFKTPIEEALPVYMDLRNKEEIPSLGLVLVIDKSGSMSGGTGGVNKMELAKEAAIQATQILGSKDQIGVVAFDGQASWVVPMQKLDNLQEIQDLIGTIRPDGGTDIYPGLNLAYQELKDAKTKIKHIILLTDGMSATSGDYEQLAEEMKKEKITMSTVAVGSDADTMLLPRLADWGGGRYYFTNDIESIPQIFTRETMMAARSYIVEENFAPKISSSSPIVGSLYSGIPSLDGYIAVSPKETAEVALITHKEDPLLAQWQYGLGRSVAYTSDAAGRWSTSWVSWDGFNRFWGDLTTWTLPRDDSGLISVDTRLNGEEVEIIAEIPAGNNFERLTEASIVGPELETQHIILDATGPGRYKGKFQAESPGVYLIQVTQKEGENISVAQTTGFVVPYSPEFTLGGMDRELLQAVAEGGGGKILTGPKEAFADNLPRVQARNEGWPYLLMIAVSLLPFDVAVRRLWFNKGDFKRFKETIRDKMPSVKGGQDISHATFGKLKERKTEVARARETLKVEVSPEEIKSFDKTLADNKKTPDKTKEKEEDFTQKLLAAKKKKH